MKLRDKVILPSQFHMDTVGSATAAGSQRFLRPVSPAHVPTPTHPPTSRGSAGHNLRQEGVTVLRHDF